MMTRRSGRWTAFTYLLALPALALLLVAFAEPQVTMAQGAKTPGTVTASPTEHKKVQVADPATVEEKKKLEAEYKAKMEKLKADHAAATDPEEKKAIEAKMQKVKQYYAQVKMTVDLSDPVAVEKLITEISKKREVLKAKSAEITDPATQEKIQQELDMLAKKQQELKTRLAQLQAGK